MLKTTSCVLFAQQRAASTIMNSPCKTMGVQRFFSTTPPPLYTIDASKIQVQGTKSPKQKFTDKTKLVFGREFTDHMLEIEWDQEKGWGTPLISAYHNLSLPPSASVLHYGLECFEGMKAYKDDKGSVRLFRPYENAKRLNRSAARLRLPTFNDEGFVKSLEKLVIVDKDWIPSGKGYSMYIRPTLISTQKTLGVGPASSALLFIIMSPVGPYYPTGFKPVKLLADDVNVRSYPGGTGAFKLGGNYAPTIAPQAEAAAKGYSQILWLLGDNITEVGTMNMFVLWKTPAGQTELITPPLTDGTILPGITRDSIIQLAKKWGEFTVSERPFTITEVLSAIREGRMIEAFGAGTAAIVSPIESISYKGTDYKVPVDVQLGSGRITKRVLDEIMAIQYGEVPHPWSIVVPNN